MNYEETKETLVELIENDELTESQLEYMLKWVQGNGYVAADRLRDALEDMQLALDGHFLNKL